MGGVCGSHWVMDLVHLRVNFYCDSDGLPKQFRAWIWVEYNAVQGRACSTLVGGVCGSHWVMDPSLLLPQQQPILLLPPRNMHTLSSIRDADNSSQIFAKCFYDFIKRPSLNSLHFSKIAERNLSQIRMEWPDLDSPNHKFSDFIMFPWNLIYIVCLMLWVALM